MIAEAMVCLKVRAFIYVFFVLIIFLSCVNLSQADYRATTPVGSIHISAHSRRLKASIKKASRPVSPLPEVETLTPVPVIRPISSQRFAVVIGISNYKDSRIPSLRYASDDARAFYNWLISSSGGRLPPARVKILLDREATGRKIRDALYVWLRQALEEDVVIIYFAGHGSPESPDASSNLFLLPYDTEYSDIATTGFPVWDVKTAIERFIKAKKVIVIADACHAGGIGQSFDIARRENRGIKINPISSGLEDLSKIGDGVCVISATGEKELSEEGRKWNGHGVFTYFLLKGLKGNADYNRDKKVTLGELIPYLSEHVRRSTKSAQSPEVAGKFDPALTIGR